MSYSSFAKSCVEVLESRIAPAALLPTADSKYVKAVLNSEVIVRQGEVLSTGSSEGSGSYLLFMEKGNARAFFTDFNANGQVDFNELTGLSVGDGARVVLFTDLHGDIVTNLKETTVGFGGSSRTFFSLTDSDSNSANGNDGRIVLNHTIEKVELRSLQATDLPDRNADGVVDDFELNANRAQTTFSIFGNIYAGGGFGTADGGLIINTARSNNFGFAFVPTIGAIKVGSSVSGEFFSFGSSGADEVSGLLTPFLPARGQVGADIIGVAAFNGAPLQPAKFNLDGLYAGDGGAGARGGNIQNVAINGDTSGGYDIIAGNGGDGPSGGNGGKIINLSDVGSTTGKIAIRTGDGGTGATGTGGDGGTITFGDYSALGNVQVKLGDGGNGFTKGGDGASLLSGNFTQSASLGYTAGTALGTTHNATTTAGTYAAKIGSHEAIDFDKDGNGDFVFTTRGTSQVVVMFGDGFGGFRTRVNADGVVEEDRVYLSGVSNPEAITVADLNNDGQLDIAVASTNVGSMSGVVVFFNQFEHNGPGAPVGGEDLDGDGLNDFIGFSSGRVSTLPQLNGVGQFWSSPTQVSNLVAGDFNGDGLAELAVVATYYGSRSISNGVTQGLGNPFQVLLFLTPDVETDVVSGTSVITGQFYADFGTTAAPLTPYITLDTGGAESFKVEASALSAAYGRDVVFAGKVGEKSVNTYGFNLGSAALVGSYALGAVDTNRGAASGNNNNTTDIDVTLRDFTVFDFNEDGNADIAAISEAPALFAVGVAGTGLGGGTQVSGNGADQSGIFFGERGFDTADALLGIKSVALDGDGLFDDLAVLGQNGNPTSEVISLVKFGPGSQGAATGSTLVRSFVADAELSPTQAPVMFDAFYPTASSTVASYGVADSNPVDIITFTSSLGILSSVESLHENGLRLQVGNGGNSAVGSGGAGGSLGGATKIATETTTTVDPITGAPITTSTLVGALNLTLNGTVSLLAGSGGDGFAKGGAGGSINGVVTFGPAEDSDEEEVFGLSSFTATAGDGGRGVSGAGGAGGGLKNNSINALSISLLAGNGGTGATGGNGGSILGNGTNLTSDAITGGIAAFVQLIAGDGAFGTKRGGVGGSIDNFRADFSDVTTQFESGTLLYTAGNGGNSISGDGGAGGSITRSSPNDGAVIDDRIVLTAGNGGSGVRGGAGGGVSSFVVSFDADSASPQFVSVLAGHGGSGSTKNGGTGGGIKNVNIDSRGLAVLNTILAGNGGTSAGAKGGSGGVIQNVNTSTQIEGAFAVVGGAGGNGLTAGGNGGSILDITMALGGSVAGQPAKGLIVAGAGGNASAFVPNQEDPSANQAQNAFGGTIGKGGKGGDINGFTQTGSNSAHFDFIAGNGGDTINYGVFLGKSPVGNGGSVRNIFLDGTVGNDARDIEITPENENVPIKSYNNILAGETIAQYVENNIRNGAGTLSDDDGNVGIIVGIAGRNKPVLQNGAFVTTPTSNGLTGSLINVSATSITSAVAGSVDRIAAILLARNLQVDPSEGVLGADKGSFVVPGQGVVGQLDYISKAGGPTPSPELDGRLVDGAIITSRFLDAAGRPVNFGGRVFQR